MAYIVAIDAGHGSNTAGKRTVDGYREHWINVQTAYYLEQALQRCGFKTVRIAWDDTNAKDDVDVSLAQRQKLVKSSGALISVSCHANACGDGSTWNSGQGVETLIHNSSTKVNDSKALANKVQAQLIKGTKQTNRGVKTMELAMCNCKAMGTKASILIEIGFMTNKHEAELMKTEAFCKECGEEVAQGVCDYVGVAFKSATTSKTQTVETKKEEDDEVVTTTKILVDGKEFVVDRILKDGTNYVKLRDMETMGICKVDYDESKKLPIVEKV